MKLTDNKIEQIKNAVEIYSSMNAAATACKIHFNTFKRYAVKLGIYKPNQGLKGKNKEYKGNNKILLDEILKGMHPSYQTFKLKIRLLSEGIFENKCLKCSLSEWNNEQLDMELDHIDGDRTNHILTNLRMLCPNCHAQTPTYRSKNRK
jgi:hypothetical protein